MKTEDYILGLVKTHVENTGKGFCLVDGSNVGYIAFVRKGNLTPVNQLQFSFQSNYWFFKEPEVNGPSQFESPNQKYVAYFTYRNNGKEKRTVESLIDNIVNHLIREEI